MRDPDLLKTFIAVADRGGFTAAGAVVGRSQSAVSMQIRRLEEEVGKPLLHRTRHSVRLTPEGEVLLGYARRLLRLGEEALAATAGRAPPSILRIGCIDEWAAHILPPLFRRFAETDPTFQVTLTTGATGDLMSRLGRDYDVVIGLGGARPGADELLARASMVWAVADDWRALAGRRPLPLALHPDGCRYRKAALDALDRQGIPWNTVYTSAGCGAVEAAVHAGLAVTPVLSGTIPDGLTVVPGEYGLPILPEQQVIARRAAGGPAIVDRFLAFLIDETAAAPPV